MNTIAEFLLFCTYCISFYSFIAFAILLKSKDMRLYKSATNGVYAATGCTAASILLLIASIVSHDFSLKIASYYSQSGLSLFYNGVSILASESGFFFILVLLFFLQLSFFLVKDRYRNDLLFKIVTVFLLFFIISLLTLIIFKQNPFEKMISIPENGKGLAPYFRNPLAIIVQPLTQLFGFVGIAFTYIYFFAAFALEYRSRLWMKRIRCWAVISWFFLMVNIILKCRLSYHLGTYGVYWNWTFDEMLSLLPLFFITAFLHSVIIEEKRGMLRLWNVVLIVFAFCSNLFSATPYGIRFLSSASSNYFILFICFTAICSTILIAKRALLIRTDNRLESFLSRESSFLMNNLLFLAGAFVILWGISLPSIGILFGKELSIGPSFFNQIIIPLGLSLILLTGVCSLLGWKKCSVNNFIKNCALPFAGSVICMACLFFFLDVKDKIIISLWGVSIFVLIAVVYEFVVGAALRKESFFLSAFLKLISRNRRKYGGYIIHIGVVIFALGLGGLLYNENKMVILDVDKSVTIKDYILTYNYIEDSYPVVGNTFVLALNLSLQGAGEETILKPQMEFHRGWTPYARTDIYSSLFEYLYVRWYSYDNSTASVTLELSVHPLISLLWIGGLIILLGTVIVLTPAPVKRRYA